MLETRLGKMLAVAVVMLCAGWLLNTRTISTGVAATKRVDPGLASRGKNDPPPSAEPARVVAEAGAQAQAIPGPEPAEKFFKNIQVLKGVKAVEILPIMNAVASSLGVECGACHVNNPVPGGWRPDLDDKPMKKTAREMMKMVSDLNHSTFSTREQVTCYTCHRGLTRPVASPALPSLAATRNPATSTESLPSAEQLIEKYLQAIGGKAALEKIKYQSFKVVNTAQGNRTEVHQAWPDKFRLIAETPQGSRSLVVNGNDVWMNGQRQPLEVAAFASVIYQMMSFDVLKLRAPYPPLQVHDKLKVADHEMYPVVAQLPDSIMTYYFDTQSGLIVRMTRATHTLLGDWVQQTDFSDYQRVEGILVPMRINFDAANQPRSRQTFALSEVKFSAQFDESEFKPSPPKQ